MLTGVELMAMSCMGILGTLYNFSADAAFGLDTKKCYGETQPDSAVLFLRLTFGLVGPVLALLVAFFVHVFPIKGERLAALEADMAAMLAREPTSNLVTSGATVVPVETQ